MRCSLALHIAAKVRECVAGRRGGALQATTMKALQPGGVTREGAESQCCRVERRRCRQRREEGGRCSPALQARETRCRQALQPHVKPLKN